MPRRSANAWEGVQSLLAAKHWIWMAINTVFFTNPNKYVSNLIVGYLMMMMIMMMMETKIYLSNQVH